MHLSRPKPYRLLMTLTILAVAIWALLPTRLVERPGVAFPLVENGQLIMLTVTQDDVSILGSLWCELREQCAIGDAGHTPDPQAPATAQEAARVATKVAAELASVPVPQEFPTVSGVYGNSAGLAFGLAQYLDFTDSHPGTRVAATGTLNAQGQVGPVGAVPAKALLAQESGASLLLVPKGSAADAKHFHGQVVEVESLDEAVTVICSLTDSICPAVRGS